MSAINLCTFTFFHYENITLLLILVGFTGHHLILYGVQAVLKLFAPEIYFNYVIKFLCWSMYLQMTDNFSIDDVRKLGKK